MSRKRFALATPEVKSGFGQYSFGSATGIIAAGLSANSELFQFRWDPTDANHLAVIREIKVSAAVSTTYFAAGVPLELSLLKATAWTAQGTGGTGITPAALLKRRTSMPSTKVQSGDIRIATTGALGAGTKTLETVPNRVLLAGAPITSSLSGQIFAPNSIMLQADVDKGEYPMVLADQEGFVITAPNVPGTGTWKLSVHVQWEETDRYPY